MPSLFLLFSESFQARRLLGVQDLGFVTCWKAEVNLLGGQLCKNDARLRLHWGSFGFLGYHDLAQQRRRVDLKPQHEEANGEGENAEVAVMLNVFVEEVIVCEIPSLSHVSRVSTMYVKKHTGTTWR
jgi:hypothetical protein